MIRRLLLIVPLLAVSALARAGMVHSGPNKGAIASGAVANGVIGNLTDNDSTAGGNNLFVFSTFSATTPGQVTHGHFRVDADIGNKMTIALYDINGNKLAEGNMTYATNARAWANAQLTSSYTVAAGTVYILGVVTNDASVSAADKTSCASATRYIAMNYADSGLPNFNPASATTVSAGKCFTTIFNTSSADPN